MSLLRGVQASIRLSGRRLLSRFVLTVGVLLAMASLVAIWVGVPLYAESASSRLLSTEVGESEADSVPFGYLFSFNRLSSETQRWAEIDALNEFFEVDDTSFGSEVREQRRVVETLSFDVYLGADVRPGADDRRLDRLNFSAVDTLDVPGFTLTSGQLPVPSAGDSGPVDVLISDELSATLGIDAGQQLLLVNPRVEAESAEWLREIRVSGTWTTSNEVVSPESRFLRTGSVRDSLLVSEETIERFVAPLDDASISSARWLILLDPARVTTDNVDELLSRGDRVGREVNDVLPGARMVVSPESSLETYEVDVTRLNNGLRAFSIPTIAMLMAVVGLVVAMSWSSRQAELTMLRSRGVRAAPIVVAGVLEALLLALLACAIGAFAAAGIAGLIGRTETFMRLSTGVDLTIVANQRAVRSVIWVGVALVLIQLVPYLSFAGWTRRTRRVVLDARSEMPWWQRGRADIILAAISAAFGFFVLRSQTIRGNLLDDPVVILLPAAITLAAGLVILRLTPKLAGGVAELLERTDSTAALLAFRKASRTPAASAAPLLLLVLTGALSIYTASLARTMDLQLVDRAHHVVGASNSMVESSGGGSGTGGVRLPPTEPGPPVDATAPARVWGLDSASRVAVLPGRARHSGGGDEIAIAVHAVDPVGFGSSAFWRADYATQSLSTLMGRLHENRDGVLLLRRELARNDISVGDPVTVRASDGEVGIDLEMVVVGHFDQFPSWQPSDPLSPAVISLPDLEQRVGRTFSSRIIFSRTDAGRDDGQTRADFARIGLGDGRVDTAADLVDNAQREPDRQGVFGLLTVSFLLSSALTIAGFVFYAMAGSRRQLVELGVLRAGGLRQRSLSLYIALDLLVVALFGIGAAVLVGVTMSRVLLPRLVGTAVGSAPSLLPEIDWLATSAIALALVAVFIVTTAGLLVVLRRIRLFEAVKIGAER